MYADGLTRLGDDLCVFITGGDTPHLGALTAASPTTPPKSIVFDTHKEYYVTEMAAPPICAPALRGMPSCAVASIWTALKSRRSRT